MLYCSIVLDVEGGAGVWGGRTHWMRQDAFGVVGVRVGKLSLSTDIDTYWLLLRRRAKPPIPNSRSVQGSGTEATRNPTVLPSASG